MRTSFKTWSLAIAANLVAALIAALAFGAWKRSQEQTVSPQHSHGFYERADDVGYIMKANAQKHDVVEENGRALFDVTYTTGPDHFRIVPKAADNPDACVLVFGHSFAFGMGVADDDTFSAQLVKRSGHRIAVHNFSGPGWGPHQTLAGLQSGRFQRALRCKPTDAVFLMIPSLIWRINGVLNTWDDKGPRYRLGEDGRPMRDGVLSDADPYNWRRWFGLSPVDKEEAKKLALAVIVEAVNELKRVYPGIRIHFISYRVASWSDVGLSADDMVSFEYDLNQAGITPLPLEAIIPDYRFNQSDYIHGQIDQHPNAKAHSLIADFLLRRIGR